MLNNKTVLKICSVVIAICLWVYVIGEIDPDSRKKISNIEVSYANTEVLAENGLAVTDEEGTVISAVIEGRRSDVNDAKKQGIKASVDVSRCKKGSNSLEIVFNLPDGVKLDSASEQKIKVNVGELVSEEKPVQIRISDTEENSEQIPWVIGYNPKTVYVRGAENIVDKVDHVAGIVSGTKVTEQMKNVQVDIVPVDKNGNEIAGVETSYEVVFADVQLLSTKKVKLDIKTENLAGGLQLEDIKADETVWVVGQKAVLDSINKLEGTVDLTGMTSSGKAEISIDVPDGVYLYNEENSKVAEVTLKPASDSTR